MCAECAAFAASSTYVKSTLRKFSADPAWSETEKECAFVREWIRARAWEKDWGLRKKEECHLFRKIYWVFSSRGKRYSRRELECLCACGAEAAEHNVVVLPQTLVCGSQLVHVHHMLMQLAWIPFHCYLTTADRSHLQRERERERRWIRNKAIILSFKRVLCGGQP